jgi:hypothetical protein
MTGFAQPINIYTLIDILTKNKQALDSIPEFSFLSQLIEEKQKRGCFCGLSKDLLDATSCLNGLLPTLNQEQADRIKLVLGLSQLCFAVQTATSFELRCM